VILKGEINSIPPLLINTLISKYKIEFFLNKLVINHFSGHGVTVIGRPTRRIFDESHYIIWDGLNIEPYERTQWHDCMVMYDMELVSIQRLRDILLLNGIEPVIIFSCSIGESSHEIPIKSKNGEHKIYGLASYCQLQLTSKVITIRDYITKTNLLISDHGYKQKCEVVCNTKLLDDRLYEPKCHIKPIWIQLVDMCRVYGNKEDFIINHDSYSP
jgi:hypothetical protein